MKWKYACPECGGHVAIAEAPPLPFERSKAEAGLLAMIGVSKFSDHMPLYRQEGIFRRHGIDIPRSTQCDWMRRIAEEMEPLIERMRRRVRSSAVIQTDDTPVTLRDGPGKGRREARFWGYRGDDANPYLVYDFSPNRRSEHPFRWLAGCEGYLQCDAYGGYDPIFAQGRLIEVGCWAHVRRKFIDSRVSDKARADRMVDMIGALYGVERTMTALAERRAARSRPLTREKFVALRRSLRRKRSKTIVDAIMATLHAWEIETTPKSTLGRAVRYAVKLETALRRYLDDGRLEIDNNLTEQGMRGIALGRKNWLFCGSETGGATAATLFTLLASARRHEIEPWAYLRDVLDRMPHAPASRLDEFLPDNWKRTHPEAHLPLNR